MSAHVQPKTLSEAEGPARRAMLEHLASCAACREAAVLHDPSLLFALLALAPIPKADLDAVSAEVAHRAGRERGSFGELLQERAWPRRVAAAAVVVLALAAGYVMREGKRIEPEAISQRVPQPVEPTALPHADVAVDSPRGVSQVIDMTVGDTQVVMVYNKDLNL